MLHLGSHPSLCCFQAWISAIREKDEITAREKDNVKNVKSATREGYLRGGDVRGGSTVSTLPAEWISFLKAFRFLQDSNTNKLHTEAYPVSFAKEFYTYSIKRGNKKTEKKREKFFFMIQISQD